MFKIFQNIFSYIGNFFNKQSFSACDVEALGGNAITYYLSDPSNPELTETVIDPKTYKLNFTVNGFSGRGAPLNTPQGQAANTFAVLCHGINVINKKLDFGKWALVKNLMVLPRAGVQANAFYDRQYLKFFYFNSGSKQVFTCLSADVISHEMGHAFLDAMRPEFFSMASTEIWAFHESFGDVTAIFCSLCQPKLVKYCLEKTGGDLKKPNIIEGLAEEFGANLGLGSGLRKAFNSFVYVKPESLPKQAPPDQLSNECHSFSRVMTGAFYDVFTNLYDMYGRGEGAIAKCVDLLLPTYLEANKKAPGTASYFASFCKTWAEIVKAKDAKVSEMMFNVFASRNILPKQHMNLSVSEMNVQFLCQEKPSEEIIMQATEARMKVSDLFKDAVFAQSDIASEIMQCNLILPIDETMVMGENGFMACSNIEGSQACVCAKDAVEHIIENDLYGPEDHKMWYKDDSNTLTRKFISCDGSYTNNCLVPGNPEFGKCWKCKNNTGCCTYGSCGCEQKPPVRVLPTCNMRYNSCTATRYNASCGYARYNENP